MERFVQVIVAGGLSFVAGLWLVELFPVGSGAWVLGGGLALLGVGGLGYGIWTPLDR